MWPFRRKERNVSAVPLAQMSVEYRQMWRDMPQPDPGADSWAWNTLALPAFTPIGAGNHAISKRLRPFNAVGVQLFTQQGAVVEGVPTTAGQFIHQPLLVPESQQKIPGYS